MPRTRTLWASLYIGWITVCVLLFVALRGQEDPSRRHDRILSTDAGTRAVAILRQRDPNRFAGFDVVHVAYAGRGEGGPAARWVVLCDRVSRTGLREAVVVEVDAASGTLLAIRRPSS